VARRERVADLFERPRLLFEERPRLLGDGLEVDAIEPPPKDARHPAREHRLHRRAEAEEVLRARDMDRPAEHRRADGFA
jgi:hypothetical protein